MAILRRLKNLVLSRIDLVDAPANPGARVMLLKRDSGMVPIISVKTKEVPMADSVRKKAADSAEERAEFLRVNDPSYKNKYGQPLTKAQAFARASMPVNRGGDRRVNELMQQHQDAKLAGVADALAEVDQPVAKADSAWSKIEAHAAGLVQKSGERMSRQQAIDLVMKMHPDLVRAHYIEAHGRDPLTETRR